ncbi:ABC-F family ATP-binding cassette domain-containing protein [Alkalihalobacillus sp. AL-G]|uniref:ABC-F family ATP-binding cassette domain-containing protein n=1 Tax=Alkalihalobacillus sp. AL-G TaxID=2926399 RepID=UPI00272B9610|nr:ABC-F family ATP-binding cassette domain-containing protein [Alkalihalobacillus sp. AL-G]WLD94185.1 ATP-binding cassette domain-containing protein [Alkalihalobacillus sp. AL-G]
MSMIHVTGLTHGFGDRMLFNDIEFRLLKGEHVGLVGANGTGKSTLLKLLTDKIISDEGEIEVHSGIELGYLEQHPDFERGQSIKDYLRSAFQRLFDLEKDMVRLTERLSMQSNEQLEDDLIKYGEIQETLEINRFYELDAHIEEVAAGLGIAQLGMEKATAELSGGQRTKLMLAKLLLQKPDVLLLDEPTNYLDDLHIEWLRSYLATYPNAFVLISHDTRFMNEVVNVIYHLEHKNITRYVGNYNAFVEAYELRKQQIHQAFSKQQKEIDKLEDYIRRNKARASTAKQAKSREKQLGKIDRIDKPVVQPKSWFGFEVCRQPNQEVITTSDLAIGYDEPLINNLNLTLKKNEKVAITGHNGIGKTTTLRTLLGQLKPISGSVNVGSFVRPAYLEQEIEITGDESALQHVWSRFPNLEEKEVRKRLARSGLKSEHIYQPMMTLSGGEQTKVRLTVLMLQESNLLILDEPTNHLDIKAKEALRKALQVYKGTILLVSHEPEFYEQWVTDIWNVESWRRA